MSDKKPQISEYDTMYAWISAITEYEERQIARLKSWDKSKILPPKMNGVIDGRTFADNHRVVFIVTNSIGQRAIADTSKQAMEIARDAVNQPCHVTVCPIMPTGSHHTTPLERLKELIEQSLE